jgi:hypothetical protein
MTAEQITDLAALAGKTIARAIGFGMLGNPGAIGLVFTDESCAYFSIESGYDKGDRWIAIDVEPYADEQVDLGMMTQMEYDRFLADRKARERQENEARERAEYDRLRAKFEGGPTT